MARESWDPLTGYWAMTPLPRAQAVMRDGRDPYRTAPAECFEDQMVPGRAWIVQM